MIAFSTKRKLRINVRVIILYNEAEKFYTLHSNRPSTEPTQIRTRIHSTYRAYIILYMK